MKQGGIRGLKPRFGSVIPSDLIPPGRCGIFRRISANGYGWKKLLHGERGLRGSDVVQLHTPAALGKPFAGLLGDQA